MDDYMEWVTVSEAARRLGVTRQAIRGRIARKTIPFQHDNRGNPLVKAVAGASVPPSGTVRNDTGRNDPTVIAQRSIAHGSALAIAEPAGPVSLDDVRVMLGEQAERMERQQVEALDRQQRQHEAEIARLRADHAAQRRGDLAMVALVASLALVEILMISRWIFGGH